MNIKQFLDTGPIIRPVFTAEEMERMRDISRHDVEYKMKGVSFRCNSRDMAEHAERLGSKVITERFFGSFQENKKRARNDYLIRLDENPQVFGYFFNHILFGDGVPDEIPFDQLVELFQFADMYNLRMLEQMCTQLFVTRHSCTLVHIQGLDSAAFRRLKARLFQTCFRHHGIGMTDRLTKLATKSPTLFMECMQYSRVS